MNIFTNKYSSVLIPAIGMPIQFIMWGILFSYSVESHGAEKPLFIEVFQVVWFSIPLIALLGYRAAFYNMRERKSFIQIIGILLNTVWLLILCLFLWAIITGVQV